jgi:hypothetical protein
LQQSYLNDFDVLLTGYIASAEAVQVVGKIGRELKYNSGMKPGSFFWGKLKLKISTMIIPLTYTPSA